MDLALLGLSVLYFMYVLLPIKACPTVAALDSLRLFLTNMTFGKASQWAC